MSKQIRAAAKIQVTVQVESGVWGSECSIEVVYRQVVEEGLEKVRKMVIASCKAGEKMVLVGEPKVIGVLTESVD